MRFQKNNILNYETEISNSSNNTKNETLVYNELYVPYGKRLQVILSDGTHVHVNAGTTLKYPIRFIEGKERKVFLEGGEAFFDVTKDEKNAFIVNVNKQNIKVLGTRFNVSSYPEDEINHVVLVEGSVSLYENSKAHNDDEAILLEPGFKAGWNTKHNNILISEVDTSTYTGWIEGKLIFKNIPFKSIRKKLERFYNVTIINNNKVLDNNTYNAVFDVETIDQVLETLNENYPIEYVIENNQIIIK